MNHLSAQLMATLLEDNYGLKGLHIKQLGGYTDLNFIVINPQGFKYVLKVSCEHQKQDNLRLQNIVTSYLKDLSKKSGYLFPQLVFTQNGEDMFSLQVNGKHRRARLFRYIEGTLLWDLNYKDINEDALRNIGVMTAQLSLFLAQITQKKQVKDILGQVDLNSYRDSLLRFPLMYEEDHTYLDKSIKTQVQKARKQFDQLIKSLSISQIQLIHNDISPSNILVRQKEGSYILTGAIDFCSMVCSYPLIELVIVAARMTLDPHNPLKNIIPIIKGYHSIRPLSEQEQEILFPLIKTRLCFVSLIVCRQHFKRPACQYMLKIKNQTIASLKLLAQNFSSQQFITMLQESIKQ